MSPILAREIDSLRRFGHGFGQRKKPAETDWAWLAGFVEGEGTFHATIESARHIYPELVASSVTPVLLHRCREIAGGNVWGPFGRGHLNNKWRPAYRWHVRSLNLVVAIEHMMPFLLLKREQAEMCMVLRSEMQNGATKGEMGRVPLSDDLRARRETVRSALMALNQRGTCPLTPEQEAAIRFARSEVQRLTTE